MSAHAQRHPQAWIGRGGWLKPLLVCALGMHDTVTYCRPHRHEA
jgi:hypothetical protein